MLHVKSFKDQTTLHLFHNPPSLYTLATNYTGRSAVPDRESNTQPFTIAITNYTINPLDSKGNYSATSNNTKLIHWPLMGGGCYIWYSDEGTGRGCSPPRPLLSRPLIAVPYVTAHPSMASVPITVVLWSVALRF